MEPKLVSIGKVAAEFNLATSGSDDVLAVKKGATLTTWDDAIVHAPSKLIKGLLIMPSITQGLSRLVNESKVKNVNQGINVALGNVTTLQDVSLKDVFLAQVFFSLFWE